MNASHRAGRPETVLDCVVAHELKGGNLRCRTSWIWMTQSIETKTKNFFALLDILQSRVTPMLHSICYIH